MLPKQGFISLFIRHPLASPLLIMLMLMSGIWALSKLNTQFFPTFNLDIVSVRVVWTGASAEDVEAGLTLPLEQSLRSVDGLKSMTSTSSLGISAITLEFRDGTDMTQALAQVEDRVGQQRNLPANAETPIVSRILRYEPIVRMLLSGPGSMSELRGLARQFERELLDIGIEKVDFIGLPEEVVSIEIPSSALMTLNQSPRQIAETIARYTSDQPAGQFGRDQGGRQLRFLEQARDETSFARLPITHSTEQGRIQLGDIAHIERRSRDSETRVRYQGKPALELLLQRTESTDALEAARRFNQWLAFTEPQLPSGVELKVYDQLWQLISERIHLLLKNGVGGLILVLAILFLFLSGRLALRVALGIPIAFTTAFIALYLAGGSINMLSLFGFIMSLGIIVDNAIVVSEHAYTLRTQGKSAEESARLGAQRMLGPVIASSLTTVAAFFPLMLIGGIMGKILFEIPLVVICVILATLIISFLILPHQLSKGLAVSRAQLKQEEQGFRGRFERGLHRFREGPFRRSVTAAIRARGVTLTSAVALLILAVGLLAGGRVGFTFFPSPDGTTLRANVAFVSGTPPQKVEAYMSEVEAALDRVTESLEQAVVRVKVTRLGQGVSSDGSAPRGDQFASMLVELTSPDSRSISNRELIQRWQAELAPAAGLDMLTITAVTGGPPGRDIDVRLSASDPLRLKAAAETLAAQMQEIPGLYAVEDDTPYGREQLLLTLTPLAESLGLTPRDIASELRGFLEGALVQLYQDGLDEVEVRVRLPDSERYNALVLERLYLPVPNLDWLALDQLVEIRYQPGFETLRHADARLAIQVSAELDSAQGNAGLIRERLANEVMPRLVDDYGIDWSFQGRAVDQRETMADMQMGLVFALLAIYIVLAWMFASYLLPLVVMAIIPFGLLGAVAGHWLLGLELTLLSFFGIFGLTGIVVNNSIILVSFYQELRQQGLDIETAIIEASCQRLRAVLITSITTIVGLVPLLFETSVQAQFLIPMAVSIMFGLAVATLLVLLVIPALMRVVIR
ncbi:efflux RND transporter permease subunit [Nitrincola nitratireducens]|uniref:Putative efflux pump membrane transporter TtgB n=1 Tax=Nitrincola nitratireducens TaxID=1229521 RepID=W9V3L3_9GAMM|nr:efflux RND transporter permease subunit [Nitrincola nitratireducens]EXJ10732.1 putative efflux pump membrane transporter TtgB [Nitrincola nitratireducens]